MLTRTRLWILAALSLVGISIATYAYAYSCGGPPVEGWGMQLISVTYDGAPQVDPPEYHQVSGRLVVPSDGRFSIAIQQLAGTFKEVETGSFDAR